MRLSSSTCEGFGLDPHLVPTWSQLGPDLMPTWCRPGASGPPDGGDEAVCEGELRLGQTRSNTLPNHVAGAGAHALDVFGQVERLGEERVAGNRAMGLAQVLKGERLGKRAGIPDFEPVCEEHDLNAAVAVVVAVGNGVDNGFGNDIPRDLVGDRGLRALLAGADADIDLGHDEVDGLIDEFKGGALVNLIGGNGFGHFGAVEVGALDLGRQGEALGEFPEQQDGGVGGLAVIQEVQMGQHLGDLGLDGEREVPCLAGATHEAVNIIGIEVVQFIRLLPGDEGIGDALDVGVGDEVFGVALGEELAGVDEEDFALAGLRLGLVQEEDDAGGGGCRKGFRAGRARSRQGRDLRTTGGRSFPYWCRRCPSHGRRRRYRG